MTATRAFLLAVALAAGLVSACASDTTMDTVDSAPTTTSRTRGECTVDLIGSNVLDAVEAAIECDGERFRLMLLADDSLAGLTEGTLPGTGAAALVDRLIACAEQQVAKLTDREILAVASRSGSSDDFRERLGELVGSRCQSELASFGAGPADHVIAAIASESGGDWDAVQTVGIEPDEALLTQRDGYRLFVAVQSVTGEAFVVSLVFDPETANGEAGVEIMQAVLRVLGADASPEIVTEVVRGTASPTLPPVQVCASHDAGVAVIIVQATSIPCLG